MFYVLNSQSERIHVTFCQKIDKGVLFPHNLHYSHVEFCIPMETSIRDLRASIQKFICRLIPLNSSRSNCDADTVSRQS